MEMRHYKFAIQLFVFILMTVIYQSLAIAGSGIRFTKHNLSTSGPGSIRAASRDEICIFCHTPPNPKLYQFKWNRVNATTTYTPYQSSTLRSKVGQPTGSSRLCLSCHDGTIALGALITESAEISFKGGIRFMPEDKPAALGTDLSDDHPISMVYDARLAAENRELLLPSLLPPEIELDDNQQLQCTSCHDPHDDSHGKFLVMSNRFSRLCTACHVMEGWPQSAHAVSNVMLNRSKRKMDQNTAYRTVAENGCENCHRPHNASSHERLLAYRFEEDNCLVCHDGGTAAGDIESELQKFSRHPVQDYVGIHDAAENFTAGASLRAHVECTDCHDPHQAGKKAAIISGLPGANMGATGITAGGQPTAKAQSVNEICFKCHGDLSMVTELRITRKIEQINTRLEFAAGNPSHHPVGTTGVNADVPSLLSPWTVNSLMTCTDCHNSDNRSGQGPQGPHGSNFKYLLERQYETRDPAVESAATYALCYKCHSRASILRDESFPLHSKHVVEQNTSCSICHDPHGISGLQGNFENNPHLINFDLSAVGPNVDGALAFQDLGRFRGRCDLACHGREHRQAQYPQ